MKKLLFIANLLLIGIIWFQSCSNPKITMTNNVDPLGNGSFNFASRDTTNFSTCYGCLTDNIHGEKVSEFIDVTARYRQTHYDVVNAYVRGLLNNATGISNAVKANDVIIKDFKDARSCWYSIDTLKKFICLMEKYSAQLKIPSKELGIRFYYATYSQVVPWHQAYASRHTLYLAPTHRTQNGENEDFDPRYSATNINSNKKIVTLSSLVGDETKSNVPLFMLGGLPAQDGGVMNQGDLCPPGTGCINTILAIDNVTPNGASFMSSQPANGNAGQAKSKNKNK